MKRWLYAHRQVSGRPSALEARLRGNLRDLLRTATGSDVDELDADGSFRIRLDTVAVGLPVSKTVRVSTGVATTTPDGRLRIPLSWRAAPAGAAFPTFDGVIELEPLSARNAQIAVVGTYTLPLGVLGAAVDASLLSGAAEATGQRLVDGLAEALRQHAPERPAAEPAPSRQLRVWDVMSRDPIVFGESTDLRTAALVLFHHEISGAPVVDDHGALVGVLSERDLLHKEARLAAHSRRDTLRRATATTVGEACSRPARTTVPDVALQVAAAEMLKHDIARLVVIDDSRVAGMVTRHDVLRALLRTEEELQHSIDDLLDRLGEPGVHAIVVWGSVTLSGRARLRSYIPSIVGAVEDIDGVVSVEGHLDWEEDDLPANLPLNPMS
jgi:CBS domain-containing protein